MSCLQCSQSAQGSFYTNVICNPGNPNGTVAGVLGEVCIDTTTGNVYACTTAGSASTAVWTLIGQNTCVNYECECFTGNNCNPNPPPCSPLSNPLPGPIGPLVPVIPVPITNFPQVSMLDSTAIVPVIQGGISSQCTIDQISLLARLDQILFYAGNPNGNVAGLLGQFCLDTLNNNLYICTTAGTATSAVWIITGIATIVPPGAGGTGVSNPTAHGIAIAEGSSDFNFLTLTNGEVLIGSTGDDPVPGNITGSGGIIIDNGAGTINIRNSGGGTASVDVTTATQAMMSNTSYTADYSGGNVTFTLPTSSASGDVIRIVGKQHGWTIHQNAGQSIVVDNITTTMGTGGSLTSINAGDCIYLYCTTANTVWTAISTMGSISWV